MTAYWTNRKVLVTGGASFIGSHLSDALVELGATVRIVDDLSSGKIANIQHLMESKAVELLVDGHSDPPDTITAEPDFVETEKT